VNISEFKHFGTSRGIGFLIGISIPAAAMPDREI
jgi:hypothetical protein